MNNLVDIEKKLIELFISERKNWVSIYLLLKIVYEEMLWRVNYNSYTQWVKEFAIRSKVHESSIWHIRKMGAVYEKYSKQMESKGMKVEDIKNTKVSANNLVILEKIDKYSPEKTEELVEKIFNKEITKNDLEEIYRAVRPNKKSSDLVLNFKLNDFDGPLDLLVELIKEKKMDILTLDIAELSYQYLEFVNNNLLVLQIDDISQYLVMASYLTELKTKMLIPMLMSQDELTETELEIDRLRRQLFLYKQYKDIVGEFKSRQAIRTQLIPKVCDDLDEYTSDEIPEAPLPDHVSIDKLVRA